MAAVPDASKIPLVPSNDAVHAARLFAGVCIVLVVLATFIFAARIWTRTRPVFRMSADDHVCVVAYILVMIDCALYLQTTHWIFGGDISKMTLADSEQSFFYAIIGQPFWAWSMATIKCCVALMLLRLEQNVSWRRFLWGMVGLQLVLAVYNTLTQLLQCIPLRKAWDLLGIVEGTCWSTSAGKASTITVQVINILTDWIFALLPISFLRKVQRPLRERVVIGILMALGIFAGAASIVRIVYLMRLGNGDDNRTEAIQLGMWAVIEELVAFMAACVPCLRAPFRRVLHYLGLTSSHHTSGYTWDFGGMYDQHRVAKHTKGKSQTKLSSAIRMKSLKGTDAHSEEHILTATGEEAKGNEIWCTTEVRLEEEERVRRDPETGRGKIVVQGCLC